MSLQHADHYSEIAALLDATAGLVQQANTHSRDNLEGRLAEARHRLETEAPLRIAVIGQYSAGKSALVAALTGMDVTIDAGVATDRITEYDWRGVVLVDTPGIHSDGSGITDHDRLAREATADADLVLFVITNELFTPRLADHLHFVLGSDALDLASKTCVVVNKMDRENNPDEAILPDVERVLDPFLDVPVFMFAADRYLRAQEVDEPLAQRFHAQSRIEPFIDGLNHFIMDAGAGGRLLAPLTLTGEVLDQTGDELAANQEEQDRLEICRRKRRVLELLQTQLGEVSRARRQQIRALIMQPVEEINDQITLQLSAEELERLFSEAFERVTRELEPLHDEIDQELRAMFNQARMELEEVDVSPLNEQIQREQADQAELNGLDDVPGNRSGRAAAGLGKMAPSAQKGLEMLAENPQRLRDVIYSVGKKMGKKFAPWEPTKQADKLAGVLSGVSRALPYVAAGLEFYSNYREEKVEDEREKYLADARCAVYKAFAEQANNEVRALEDTIREMTDGTIEEALQALAAEERAVKSADADRQELQQTISDLRQRIATIRSGLGT